MSKTPKDMKTPNKIKIKIKTPNKQLTIKV